MNPNANSMVPDWEDPDDAPDLSQSPWAERLASTTIRRDPDVRKAFRSAGDGRQSRINAALREWLKGCPDEP